MPDGKKDALLTYRQRYVYDNKTPYYTKLCFVATGPAIRTKFQELCKRYAVADDAGKLYRVTTHQFRHNGITDRLAAGFTTAQIAEMTGHHGDAMIYNAYTHLHLMPATIIKKQEFVSEQAGRRENRYILFRGRILNMG
jgi:integrase